jgi:hypothetical protein
MQLLAGSVGLEWTMAIWIISVSRCHVHENYQELPSIRS